MKKQIVSMTAILCLFMSASVTSLAYSVKIKTTIPFDFTAGEAKLPAGNYQIERTTMQSVFMATNLDTGKKVKFMASLTRPDNLSGFDAEGATEAKVTFIKLGEEIFLHKIVDTVNGGQYQLSVRE
jgi:hypothetical protein